MPFPFDVIYQATMKLLPAPMDSPPARSMLFAISMQESRLLYRRQLGGPARGFWQFELGDPVSRGGVHGVLMHSATGALIRGVLGALQYDHDPLTSYRAIEHNDILACAYARLLLYTVPQALPVKQDPQEGWRQYLASWRPGRPHPTTWEPFFQQAWA